MLSGAVAFELGIGERRLLFRGTVATGALRRRYLMGEISGESPSSHVFL
jgi:hypothetical protein